MTLEELKQKAEVALQEQVVIINSQENAYYEKHNEYFGFNWTPPIEVKDGKDTSIGELQKPSRNFIDADVFFDPNSTLPFQMRVIKHNGEEGKGYTIWVRAVLDTGEPYIRAIGFGKYHDMVEWSKEEIHIDRLFQ